MPHRKGFLGFTLLEGMFSMLMVMVVLGGLARTLTNSAKVRANRQNMDQAVEQLHLMNAMRADLMNSLAVMQPATTADLPELRVRMVDTQRSFRDLIDIPNGPDDPFEASEQMEVRYRLEEGHLLREAIREGLPTERVTLAKVSDFLARREEQLVTLTLTFEYTRVNKTRTMKVELR